LVPTLEVRYRRMTLVARDAEERMTIDNRLHFRSNVAQCGIDERIFIVETKSANGNGVADKIFRALHQHPTNCSKYCVGTAATGGASKYNKFRPALMKLGALASAEAAVLATGCAAHPVDAVRTVYRDRPPGPPPVAAGPALGL
jgi:hypothetical protein